jgi:hypothetical protein
MHRRPGTARSNEYLFSMLAETNVATLNGYMETTA